MNYLIQLDKNNIINKILLKKDKYSIGREHGNDIMLGSARVSRQHAFIIRENGSYYIEDNESLNHVYVNGTKISKKELEPGDRIKISNDITFIFTSEEAPPAKAEDEEVNEQTDIGQLSETEFLRLKEITNRILTLDKQKNNLYTIILGAIELCGAERGFIVLTDKHGRFRIKSAIAYNFPDFGDKESKNFLFVMGIASEVVKKQETIFLRDDASDARLEETGLTYLIALPLIIGNELLGVLYLDARIPLREDFPYQLFLDTLASHAAITIDNTRIYKNLQNYNQELFKEYWESEQRYRTLIENTPDAIFSCRNDKIIYANPAALKLIRAEDFEQINLQNITTIIDEADYQHIKDILQETKQVPQREAVLKRLDNTNLVVELTGSLFSYFDVHTIHITIRDISKRVGLSSEKAAVLSIAVAEFASDLQEIGNDLEDNAPEAYSEIEKLKKISEQLSVLSPLKEPAKTPFSPVELIHNAATFIATAYKIEPELVFPDELWHIDADKAQMAQVFSNLILNKAQELIADETLIIKLSNFSCANEETYPLEEGDYVQIIIGKTDAEPSEEDWAEVEVPDFCKLDLNDTEPELLAAFSIIKRHGAYLSNTERGYCLLLPAVVASSEEEEFFVSFNGKVLILEEDELSHDNLKTQLEKRGLTVQQAFDEEEIVYLYEKAYDLELPYGAVIIDPPPSEEGVAGVETLLKLQDIDPEVKVIICSDYSDTNLSEDYDAFGFYAMLAKPFDPLELEKLLTEIFID